jgi:hypothetical protein
MRYVININRQGRLSCTRPLLRSNQVQDKGIDSLEQTLKFPSQAAAKNDDAEQTMARWQLKVFSSQTMVRSEYLPERRRLRLFRSIAFERGECAGKGKQWGIYLVFRSALLKQACGRECS